MFIKYRFQIVHGNREIASPNRLKTKTGTEFEELELICFVNVKAKQVPKSIFLQKPFPVLVYKKYGFGFETEFGSYHIRSVFSCSYYGLGSDPQTGQSFRLGIEQAPSNVQMWQHRLHDWTMYRLGESDETHTRNQSDAVQSVIE